MVNAGLPGVNLAAGKLGSAGSCRRRSCTADVAAAGGTCPSLGDCPENHIRRGFAMSINPKTTAAIGDHPLHPMIIPFPVAFLVGAPIADLVFISTGDGFWAR